jgi:hypothetical protein
MWYRILFLVATILCFAPATFAAHPANPGFTLRFNFKPPLVSKTAAVPAVVLDVCNDSGCSVLRGTITLTCNVKNNATRAGIVVHECSAHATLKRRGPDTNMNFLSHPVSLRVRVNNLASPPFNFSGGTPTVPATKYKFTVAPGPMGLSVMGG